jgi:hypothetical protein
VQSSGSHPGQVIKAMDMPHQVDVGVPLGVADSPWAQGLVVVVVVVSNLSWLHPPIDVVDTEVCESTPRDRTTAGLQGVSRPPV